MTILAWSPSNFACATRRSETHCSAICWIFSTLPVEYSLSWANLCLKECITFICVRFPLMSIVMRKASSIQGWVCTLSTASFCRATSTCSFNAFTCYSFASRWVRKIVFTILYTLSYCTWSSCTSVSRRSMVGSSYKEVRTVKDSSNIVV